MSSSIGACAALALAMASVACSGAPPIESLKLEGNRVTVTNTTSTDWHDVEIRVNTHYRVVVSSLRAGQRLDGSLDQFMEAYGHRFDYHRTQVKDLRLTAKLPDGRPVEIVKEFEAGGLAGALKGVGGSRGGTQ